MRSAWHTQTDAQRQPAEAAKTELDRRYPDAANDNEHQADNATAGHTPEAATVTEAVSRLTVPEAVSAAQVAYDALAAESESEDRSQAAYWQHQVETQRG